MTRKSTAVLNIGYCCLDAAWMHSHTSTYPRIHTNTHTHLFICFRPRYSCCLTGLQVDCGGFILTVHPRIPCLLDLIFSLELMRTSDSIENWNWLKISETKESICLLPFFRYKTIPMCIMTMWFPIGRSANNSVLFYHAHHWPQLRSPRDGQRGPDYRERLPMYWRILCGRVTHGNDGRILSGIPTLKQKNDLG